MREADVEAMALLQDPARRSLYDFVVLTGRGVSRNEAAQAVGLQRTLAAFHLDRLAEAGLLEVEYRRLSGRSGPGAGRPAKVYRRAVGEHALSLPPRDYARAAQVFGEALERAGAEASLFAAAREDGVAAGRDLASMADVSAVLAQRGYEPYQRGDQVRLRNCPFHALSQQLPVLTCGMNLALVQGLLEGAALQTSYAATLDPEGEGCCVMLESKNNTP